MCQHNPVLPIIDRETGNLIGWVCSCRQKFEHCPHGATKRTPEIWRELLDMAIQEGEG